VLLTALLLDERSDVRALAEGWMASPAPFLDIVPPEAQQRLRDLFADLAGLLGTEAPTGAPTTREVWRAQKEQLEFRVRDMQEANRRLKGVDDRLAHAKRKLAATETELAAARAKQEAAEKSLRAANVEREQLGAELARETAHREERLTAALDAALANEFFGWLGHARTVEREAADPGAQTDLLARAEHALRKQTETDRHTGNRQTLADPSVATPGGPRPRRRRPARGPAAGPRPESRQGRT
jgi:hypothetical protein